MSHDDIKGLASQLCPGCRHRIVDYYTKHPDAGAARTALFFMRASCHKCQAATLEYVRRQQR